MKSLEHKSRPRILGIEPQGLAARLRLECSSCAGVFEVHQGGLAGVPVSVHDCPVCANRIEIRPELYELALHEAGLRSTDEEAAYYAPQFSGTGAGFAKRPSASGQPKVIWAPALPRAQTDLHGDLIRRYIAMARLFAAAAAGLADQARFLIRPDNSEVETANEKDVDLLVDWLEGLVPDRVDIGLHRDFDLGEAEIIVTHVGAPFIEKALRAGKEVIALQLFKRAAGENLPEGALAVRDRDLEPTIRSVLVRRERLAKMAPGRVEKPVDRSSGSLDLLFVYRDDVDLDGGASQVMKHTAAALRGLGHRVDVCLSLDPDPRGYDLVHAFNIWKPETALEQLAVLRERGAQVVWSPIYLDLSEYLYFAQVTKFMEEHPEYTRSDVLDRIDAGQLAGSDNLPHRALREPKEGYHAALHTALSAVDHVCVTSHNEAKLMIQHADHPGFPYTVTPHGVDVAAMSRATARAFIEAFEVEDYILCVGAIERRKNQLLLIEALRDCGRKIVLVGPQTEASYLELCQDAGGDQVIYTGRLDRDLVASAYKAAAIHVLPSFAEGAALANLEAAAAECPMVVSNRSSEFEYFGDAVHYCDPSRRASIRAAVDAALAVAPQRGPVRKVLADRMAQGMSWERTARLTEMVYRSLLVRT
ncbi:MAG: glycosyltransferase [Planctomycetes bacterium]|nr:glycosyltransferase [Planctomycetota bacterium]